MDDQGQGPAAVTDDQATTPSDLASLAPSTLFDLTGTVAIVTGAGGGIGQWLAAGLAAAGAAVALTDIDTAALEHVRKHLLQRGATVDTIVADLLHDESPERIVRFATERFGRLDTLVNNAGSNKRMPMLDVDASTFDRIWAVNFRQPYFLAQAAARVMRTQGRGSIINITSINSFTGVEDLSVYGPTKAALGQLTRVLAIEWAAHGIRTNSLAPGFLDTPMNATHWTHPTRAPWILDRIPLARPGWPHELIGTCVLLASQAGSYITGQTIVVDGGFLAGNPWNTPAGTGLRAYEAFGGHGRSDPPDPTIVGGTPSPR